MKDIIYLFDGQGAYTPGMGQELYQKYEQVRAVFKRIDDALGEPIEDYCFGKNTSKARSNNRWLQLALTAVNLAYACLLEAAGIKPALCLGHSLGELSAVIYTGAVSWEDGVRLVSKRGELMNRAAAREPGDMLVLNGLTAGEVRVLLGSLPARERGSLMLAHINTPLQSVVSGLVLELKNFQTLLGQTRPEIRTMLLNTGGAWHNSLLNAASEELHDFLESITFTTPEKPFFSVTMQKVLRDPLEIRQSLSRQLITGLDWVAAIETIRRQYDAYFLELGPVKTLSGLLTKISKDIACKPVCWIKQPEDAAAVLLNEIG